MCRQSISWNINRPGSEECIPWRSWTTDFVWWEWWRWRVEAPADLPGDFMFQLGVDSSIGMRNDAFRLNRTFFLLMAILSWCTIRFSSLFARITQNACNYYDMTTWWIIDPEYLDNPCPSVLLTCAPAFPNILVFQLKIGVRVASTCTIVLISSMITLSFPPHTIGRTTVIPFSFNRIPSTHAVIGLKVASTWTRGSIRRHS